MSRTLHNAAVSLLSHCRETAIDNRADFCAAYRTDKLGPLLNGVRDALRLVPDWQEMSDDDLQPFAGCEWVNERPISAERDEWLCVIDDEGCQFHHANGESWAIAGPRRLTRAVAEAMFSSGDPLGATLFQLYGFEMITDGNL